MSLSIVRHADRRIEFVSANGELRELRPPEPEHQVYNMLLDQITVDVLVHLKHRSADGWNAARVHFEEVEGVASVTVRLDQNPSLSPEGEDLATETLSLELTPVGDLDPNLQSRLGELCRRGAGLFPDDSKAAADGDGGDGKQAAAGGGTGADSEAGARANAPGGTSGGGDGDADAGSGADGKQVDDKGAGSGSKRSRSGK